MSSKTAYRLGAVAALALSLTAASAARADVHWTVSGGFDDGGQLSGSFDINQYGYLSGYDLVTTGGSVEPGFEYTPQTSYYSNGTFFLDAEPGYFNALHLTFANDLSVVVANNPIVGGSPGPSYECMSSWSCYVPQGGVMRYLGEGQASAAVATGGAPEPAAWAIMLSGFGLAGAALRSVRRRTAAA